MRFWDASAVVPLLLEEPSTLGLITLLTVDSSMIVWWGTPVECASATARRERELALTAGTATQVLARLRALAESWQEVLPSAAVRATAQRLLRVHPLGAGDSLQLAAALVAAEHDPASLEFVCLDERLSDAAGREGFVLTR